MLSSTHLAFLPTREGEVSLAVLVTPASPGQGVEDDGVGVTAGVKTGVEVHRDVLGIMTNVDGKAAMEEHRGEKGATEKGKTWMKH